MTQRCLISPATRRQLGTLVGLMGSLFATLAYGAQTGNTVPLIIASVLVGIAEVVVAFVAPTQWTA